MLATRIVLQNLVLNYACALHFNKLSDKRRLHRQTTPCENFNQNFKMMKLSAEFGRENQIARSPKSPESKRFRAALQWLANGLTSFKNLDERSVFKYFERKDRNPIKTL